MKKRILSIVITGILLAVMLVGCGTGNESGKNITIKKYKGLEVEKVEAVAVTDADVEASIQSDLEILGTVIEVTDRAAQMGDTVTIDFVGKKDGVAFEGGSAEDQELELGSGMFIEGFETGIVGKKIGETFNLNLKFPENYTSEALAGQAVVFTVTLDKITYKEIPELTDAILPEIGTTAKTVEEYKASVRKSLEESNAETAKESMKQAVLEALLEQCEVKNYPDDKLIEIGKNFIFQESYMALMGGKNIDDSVYSNYEKTVEEKVKELTTMQLAIDLIAEKEAIKVTLDEYDKEVATLAAAYGSTDVDSFVSEYESVYGEGFIRSELLKTKVANFLIDNCKYKSAK
jgi:trigger factor